MNLVNNNVWFEIADVSMFPPGEGKRVCFQDYDVAVFNLGKDVFKAIDNRCPHRQGPLADGIVAGDHVFCPLHSMKINLTTGRSENDDGCVKTYPVKVLQHKVYVAFREGRLG